MALVLRVIAIKLVMIDRAIERVRPVSVVPFPSGRLGWPFCSQLQNRAASPQVTSKIGQLAAWL